MPWLKKNYTTHLPSAYLYSLTVHAYTKGHLKALEIIQRPYFDKVDDALHYQLAASTLQQRLHTLSIYDGLLPVVDTNSDSLEQIEHLKSLYPNARNY